MRILNAWILDNREFTVYTRKNIITKMLTLYTELSEWDKKNVQINIT
jgi:hypothetical protein